MARARDHAPPSASRRFAGPRVRRPSEEGDAIREILSDSVAPARVGTLSSFPPRQDIAAPLSSDYRQSSGRALQAADGNAAGFPFAMTATLTQSSPDDSLHSTPLERRGGTTRAQSPIPDTLSPRGQLLLLGDRGRRAATEKRAFRARSRRSARSQVYASEGRGGPRDAFLKSLRRGESLAETTSSQLGPTNTSFQRSSQGRSSATSTLWSSGRTKVAGPDYYVDGGRPPAALTRTAGTPRQHAYSRKKILLPRLTAITYVFLTMFALITLVNQSVGRSGRLRAARAPASDAAKVTKALRQDSDSAFLSPTPDSAPPSHRVTGDGNRMREKRPSRSDDGARLSVDASESSRRAADATTSSSSDWLQMDLGVPVDRPFRSASHPLGGSVEPQSMQPPPRHPPSRVRKGRQLLVPPFRVTVDPRPVSHLMADGSLSSTQQPFPEGERETAQVILAVRSVVQSEAGAYDDDNTSTLTAKKEADAAPLPLEPGAQQADSLGGTFSVRPFKLAREKSSVFLPLAAHTASPVHGEDRAVYAVHFPASSDPAGPSLDQSVETAPGTAVTERHPGARTNSKRGGRRTEKPATTPKRLPVRSRNFAGGVKNAVDRKRLHSSSDEGKSDRPPSCCVWSRGSKGQHDQRRYAFSPRMPPVAEGDVGWSLAGDAGLSESAERQYQLRQTPADSEAAEVPLTDRPRKEKGTPLRLSDKRLRGRAPLGPDEEKKVVGEALARSDNAVTPADPVSSTNLFDVTSSTPSGAAERFAPGFEQATSSPSAPTRDNRVFPLAGDREVSEPRPEQRVVPVDFTLKQAAEEAHPSANARQRATDALSEGSKKGVLAESTAGLLPSMVGGKVASFIFSRRAGKYKRPGFSGSGRGRLPGITGESAQLGNGNGDEMGRDSVYKFRVDPDVDRVPSGVKADHGKGETSELLAGMLAAAASESERPVENDPEEASLVLRGRDERTGQTSLPPSEGLALARGGQPQQQTASDAINYSSAREFAEARDERRVPREQIPRLPEPAGSGKWPTPAELRERRSRRKRRGVQVDQPTEAASVAREHSRSGMADYILRQAVEEESRLSSYDEQSVQFLFGLSWLGEAGEQRRKRQRRCSGLPAPTDLAVDVMSLENMLKEIKRRLQMYEARQYLSRDTPFFRMYSYLKECTQRLRLTQQQTARQSHRRHIRSRSVDSMRSAQEEADGSSAAHVFYTDAGDATSVADADASDLRRPVEPQPPRVKETGFQVEEPKGRQKLSETLSSLGYDEATETANELRFFLTKLKADLQVYVAEGQICQLIHGDCRQAAMDKEVNTPAAREEIWMAYNGLIKKTIQSLQMAAEAVAMRRRRLEEISKKSGAHGELVSFRALQEYIWLLEALEASYGYQQRVVRNKLDMGPAFFPAGTQSPPQLLPGSSSTGKVNDQQDASECPRKAQVSESDGLVTPGDEKLTDAQGGTAFSEHSLPTRKRRHNSADAATGSEWAAEDGSADVYRPRSGSHGGKVSPFSDGKWQELNALVADEFYRNCRLAHLQAAATISAVRHFQAVAPHLKGHAVSQGQLFFPFIGPEHMFFEDSSVSFRLDNVGDTGTPSEDGTRGDEPRTDSHRADQPV